MKAKHIVGIILLALVVVLLVQNTQVIIYKFLFWHISISQVILVPFILVVGFLAGILVAELGFKRAKKT